MRMISLHRLLSPHPRGLASLVTHPGTPGARKYHASSSEPPYWRQIGRWQNTTADDFLSYRWQIANTVQGTGKLAGFLETVLPEQIPPPSISPQLVKIKSRGDFIKSVEEGVSVAPMAIRLTPHILSVVNWQNPLDDPVRRQFIPLGEEILPDHPALSLDSLHETADSKAPGLVHRYPDKVLFLATSVCPVYCRFCTRSYAVGANTDTVSKASQKPSRKRWEEAFRYIEQTPQVADIVVSGGDSYYLQPEHINEIGHRLLSIPHVKRFRFATKGLAVCPSRVLDESDHWTATLVGLSSEARKLGKQIALHTHFNHPNEITWVSRKAAQFLWEKNVIVRNQSVLLRGVNDNVETMGTLIRALADMNIQPYYVYQGDMVRGVEDLRTPLRTILNLEQHLRGTIAGFMTPSFVVDLPGGGGKRLAASAESYDEVTGISVFKAPGVKDGKREYLYYDPERRPEAGEVISDNAVNGMAAVPAWAGANAEVQDEAETRRAGVAVG